MSVFASIRSNLYKDSVALMRIAQTVLARPGVQRATLLMGTPANREILASAGLDAPELAPAGPSDLMIVIEAESADALAAANAAIVDLIDHGDAAAGADASAPRARVPRSIAMARTHGVEATLAQISVPGPYAAAEALKALRHGLHVFLFSDNVPLAQERAIKELARDKGLLVMGPDCGTAILNGVPIGFANAIRKGVISLVGASGTGLQEVTCRIHALGAGVRHAIGTGSRDVHEEIGGITMCQAIDLLVNDSATRVIVIVSKPPSPGVARRVLARAVAASKPCVLLILGADLSAHSLPPHVVTVRTLADAASTAVALLQGRAAATTAPDESRALEEAARLASGQRYVRGLYSGGTFCAEAQLVWREHGMHVHSNAAIDSESATGREHTAIDLGADEFTVGRPHPMIDPAARIERLAQEARDPSTAAIILDVVLGYGAHPDPAGALAAAIVQARAACACEGRRLIVIAFVCGTEDDVQGFSTQVATLEAAGALVMPDSTTAARFAAVVARAASSAQTVPALAQE